MLIIKQAHPSTLRRLFLGRERDSENEYKSQSARRFACLSNYDIWLSLATWSRTQQNGPAGSPRLTRKRSHPEKFKSGAGGHVRFLQLIVAIVLAAVIAWLFASPFW
jgi:hypothetical protein